MAAAQMPTEEEVQRMAEKLQEQFLLEHRDDTHMDPRDIARVQNSLKYVAKFVRHNRGQFTEAYNHMIECLKWRNSFGISDIKFTDIDERLWKLGMAYNHGYDRDGNHIVILNIRLHRKDSKKALELRRWIAYSFETHQQLYPDQKMCVIFDMEGAGLSNMDMDLIRFIINCFKIYFPSLLAWLLVFNIPWVLQAAWKIVQSWLSEGAVSKVKFVTKESIQEYIAPDNLIAKFGGTDPWVYDYKAEMQRMLQEVARLDEVPNAYGDNDHFDDPVRNEDDPVQSSEFTSFTSVEGGAISQQLSVEKEDEEEGEREGEREGEGEGEARDLEPTSTGKKVRFTEHLPPTSGNRFGDNDDEKPRSRNPKDIKLMGGTSSSAKMRRRQVHRIMNATGSPQATNRRTPPQSRHRSLDVANVSNTSGLPPDLLSSRRRASDPLDVSPATGFRHLSIDPPLELVFSGKGDLDVLCTLTLTNIAQIPVAYKIKTTAPLRYKVRPNLALIDPQSVAVVHVLLIPGGPNTSITQDKFLVQSYAFESSSVIPEQSQLSAFWKTLPEHSIIEHRMRCRWTNGLPNPYKEQSSRPPAPAGNKLQSRLPPEGSKAPTQPPPPASRELQLLAIKVDRVVSANEELSKQLHKLQRLSYVIILLLILVLIVAYF